MSGLHCRERGGTSFPGVVQTAVDEKIQTQARTSDIQFDFYSSVSVQGLLCLFLVAVVVIVSRTGSLYLTQDVFEITPGPRFG